MRIFTKLCLALMVAMCALPVFAAEHYVYFDGTFANPKVWAWNSTENCTQKGSWPGDAMTKQDGKWYWELPAGKSLPTSIIFSDGTQTGDLKYVDKATYHQDGTYTEFIDPTIPNVTASPASGTYFDDGEEITVTLTASIEATIYYTTDGTEPTTSSSVYAEPLTITETTTLKTLAVAAGDKQKAQSFTYTKMPNVDDMQGGTNLQTKYYQVNPNGQKGERKTIDMQIDKTLSYRYKAANAMKHWEKSDIIAQGVARDIAQAIKGKHEYPIVDSYAIYAAYDDDNLYLGVQFVYTVWDISYGQPKQLPEQSKPYQNNGRLMWAFDLNPIAQFDGYINGTGAIWNGETQPGAKFDNGVDAVWIGSSQPGVGDCGLFLSTPDGHASYADPYLKGTNGVVDYGCIDGLHPTITKIYGQSNFEYNPSVLKKNSGFVDLKSQVETSAHTFYEWKFPLSILGISADYIEKYGIGVMFLDILGSSPHGGIPYDPSYFDNAAKAYSSDGSTSKEKEDEDKITYAPARIGKLLPGTNVGPGNDPEEPTAVEDVEADNGPVEYFNLMGVKIAEPVKGQVYIERQGAKVTKKVAY